MHAAGTAHGHGKIAMVKVKFCGKNIKSCDDIKNTTFQNLEDGSRKRSRNYSRKLKGTHTTEESDPTI